jgi:hypothetical protein
MCTVLQILTIGHDSIFNEGKNIEKLQPNISHSPFSNKIGLRPQQSLLNCLYIYSIIINIQKLSCPPIDCCPYTMTLPNYTLYLYSSINQLEQLSYKLKHLHDPLVY